MADDAVDPAFGTGAVKVTPAHDPNDFEIGKRHGLPSINVMNLDGTMNANAGPFEGQTIAEARSTVVARLEAGRRLLRTEPHVHAVGHCQRCDTIVEPMITTQWFVAWSQLARPAIEAAKDGSLRFVPDRFRGVYLNWMENIHDWCISRQLWWGHRIPVWYCQQCGETIVTEEETLTACPKCGGPVEQDPDVLDTWFSSGLWPFTTLGWPEETEDLRRFYPSSVMETGYDILFFWVARMVFFGLEFMGEVPFHTVYLHGTVRDLEGARMSKTKGNVIDPTVVTADYGTDALRFAMVTQSSPGIDIKLTSSGSKSHAISATSSGTRRGSRCGRSANLRFSWTKMARLAQRATWRWPTAGSLAASTITIDESTRLMATISTARPARRSASSSGRSCVTGISRRPRSGCAARRTSSKPWPRPSPTHSSVRCVSCIRSCPS